MSTSGLASGDESRPFQIPSVMHLNSSSCQMHTQHVGGQVYITPACDQLYENHWLYKDHMHTMINPPIIPRSRPCTQCVCRINGKVPLLKSPCARNYHRSVNHNCSCKSHTITSISDSYLETSPELPPVLHLNKHSAAITMPDGISCEINPYLEQSDVIITKTDPSSTGDTAASISPHGEQEKPMNSAHEVVRTVDVTKLGMTDNRFHCEKLE